MQQTSKTTMRFKQSSNPQIDIPYKPGSFDPKFFPLAPQSEEANGEPDVLNSDKHLEMVQSSTQLKKKRKSPSGVSTNDLTFSAHCGSNEELFPQILQLYVNDGATVADVTYGRGVFWRRLDTSKYFLYKSDINTGIDCRALPYSSDMMDCVVLDPPYMHTPGGTAHNGHQNFEAYYKNNGTGNGTEKKYHEAVLDLYFGAAKEAKRVLKHGGIFIVKCQDEVCANKQRLTHIELTNEFAKYGFVVEDLFVLVRNGKPGVSRMIQQKHARKNHSYFMVFRKNGKAK